jgi:hypothetical protein
MQFLTIVGFISHLNPLNPFEYFIKSQLHQLLMVYQPTFDPVAPGPPNKVLRLCGVFSHLSEVGPAPTFDFIPNRVEDEKK